MVEGITRKISPHWWGGLEERAILIGRKDKGEGPSVSVSPLSLVERFRRKSHLNW